MATKRPHFFLKKKDKGNHYGLPWLTLVNSQSRTFSYSRMMETQIYFTMPKKKKKTLQKNPLKQSQNPSRYYNSITNLKFPTQAKISSFFTKNPHIKIDLGAKIP
jgi:hypothetical protein